MKCQECKTDIPEGKLYCEKCGSAVQIVPDYDPEDDFIIGKKTKKEMPASDLEGEMPHPWRYRFRYAAVGLCLAAIGNLAFRYSYNSVQPQEIVTESEAPGLPAKPQFDIRPGVYDYSPVLKLSHEEGADGRIYYTLDGSTPDERGNLYRVPILVGEGRTVIRAIFIRADGTQGEEAIGTYEVAFRSPEEPVFDIPGGDYSGGFYVSLSAGEGCRIYYTTNGMEPNTHSGLYRGPVYIPEGLTVLQAVAVDAEGVLSGIVEEIYQVSKAPDPVEEIPQPPQEEADGQPE